MTSLTEFAQIAMTPEMWLGALYALVIPGAIGVVRIYNKVQLIDERQQKTDKWREEQESRSRRVDRNIVRIGQKLGIDVEHE